MNLEDSRNNYSYFSSETSRIVRQLGFAGIGIIWLFKTNVDGRQTIPFELVKPALIITVGLALDLLHYIAGTIVWGAFNRYQEKAGINEEEEFLAPKQINWPGNTFFWLKIIAMVVAYYFLFQFLTKKVLGLF